MRVVIFDRREPDKRLVLYERLSQSEATKMMRKFQDRNFWNVNRRENVDTWGDNITLMAEHEHLGSD